MTRGSHFKKKKQQLDSIKTELIQSHVRELSEVEGACIFSSNFEGNPFEMLCQGGCSRAVTYTWLLDANITDSAWKDLVGKPLCDHCYFSVVLPRTSFKGAQRLDPKTNEIQVEIPSHE